MCWRYTADAIEDNHWLFKEPEQAMILWCVVSLLISSTCGTDFLEMCHSKSLLHERNPIAIATGILGLYILILVVFGI